MDIFDLSADPNTLSVDYPPQCYNAGFAHGSVASGIFILFIWMTIWQCLQPRQRTIAGRLAAAERDLQA
jgi:hypothetical protein